MTYCCSLTLPHDCLKTQGGEFPTRETNAAEAHVGENSINMVTGLKLQQVSVDAVVSSQCRASCDWAHGSIVPQFPPVTCANSVAYKMWRSCRYMTQNPLFQLLYLYLETVSFSMWDTGFIGCTSSVYFMKREEDWGLSWTGTGFHRNLTFFNLNCKVVQSCLHFKQVVHNSCLSCLKSRLKWILSHLDISKIRHLHWFQLPVKM